METTESLQLNLKTDNQVADNSNANKKRHFDTDQEPVTENENDEIINYVYTLYFPHKFDPRY